MYNKPTSKLALISLLIAFSSSSAALSLNDCKLDTLQAKSSIQEHVFGGAPDDTEIYGKRAYALSYNNEQLVPRWAAWHINKEYRDTPRRKSRWSTFRKDSEISTVVSDEYKGWYASEFNFARGHIAPYFISGGDRDNDGMDAEIEETLAIEDEYDACTVFEINSMVNVAPQYHRRFNGTGGGWYTLESEVRGLVDNGKEFNVFAGTIFVKGLDVQKIGNRNRTKTDWGIGVPHGYFKIIIDVQNEIAVAFLFDHESDLAKGCDIDSSAVKSHTACIVPIKDIEDATGLKFFKDLDTATNKKLRSRSSKLSWDKITNK